LSRRAPDRRPGQMTMPKMAANQPVHHAAGLAPQGQSRPLNAPLATLLLLIAHARRDQNLSQ
jgi:hypothetical protein